MTVQPFPDDILASAKLLVAELRQRQARLVTAESCTGGLLAAAITEVVGASDVFDRGYVTYSDEAKTDLLGVPAEAIASRGAVSSRVAIYMATGAMARARAGYAIAVTGIAGPGGGTAEKPVGRVHIAIGYPRAEVIVSEYDFGDIGRANVRIEAVRCALTDLRQVLERQAG